MSKIQAVRGMNDILPQQTPGWQYLESCFLNLARRYGYQEIRFPVLEQTQLFRRSIGEVTDIVEKEMYSFEDRNGDHLSLRPEGTAGCVRAAEQHGLLYNQQQRLWYQGPMFRHERPQKGRYRQFDQFGIEAFGMAGPDIDAEVILFSARLWQELGIQDQVHLEINNIGNAEDRRRYGAALKDFLLSRAEQLDEDSRRRLHSNPLRILDSKHDTTRRVLHDAPVLAEFVNSQSRQHFDELKILLQTAGVAYQENPRLVRGLDYYNNCVFEWITEALGAQGTVCAGGRYDGLVTQLGGRPTPAVGFAGGKERLVLLLEELGRVPSSVRCGVDVYLAVLDQSLAGEALQLAESLRSELVELRLQVHCGGGKYASQMKKAFQCGAKLAIILEAQSALGQPSSVRLRPMNDEGGPVSVPVGELAGQIRQLLAG